MIQVLDLDGSGLLLALPLASSKKAQQHIAQGKRSGTLGNSFSANFALKGQKLEKNQIMLLPLQGDIPNGYIPRALPWAMCCWAFLLEASGRANNSPYKPKSETSVT